jgi:glycosyltransferase involved in cell wall biosynthesis
MMKVLLITNIFPNFAEMERGIFTYKIAMALISKCSLKVIAPLPWVPPFMKRVGGKKFIHADVSPQENWDGLNVYHPRYFLIPKIMGFIHPMFMYMRLLHLAEELNRKESIDLINAHWLFPDGVAAAWIARKLRKPLILTGLGCDVNHYPSLPFRQGQIKKALNYSDLITVKGSGLRQKILHMGIQAQKVTVIPNGLDLNQFRIMDKNQVRSRLGIHGKGPFLLFVGSFDPVKGGHYLIEALKNMAEDPENFPDLLMVGDGPLKEDLLAQAKNLGIANRVSFLGKRPHHEIPLWMNAADVFCLPSIREGRPNVLLEALACGTPAVASEVGSVPEIIHERNGRLAKTSNPQDLAQQLLTCLKQPWDREVIRKTVGTFTWDDCAELYIRAYQKVLRESFKPNEGGHESSLS